MLNEKEIIDLATASVRNELAAHVGHITVSLSGVEHRLGEQIGEMKHDLAKLALEGCSKGIELRSDLRNLDRRSMAVGGGAGGITAALAILSKWLFGGAQ